MGIRVYISAPVNTGDIWRATAEAYCTGGFVNIFPSKANGTPATDWVVTIGRATDWTAADADATLTLLLPPGYTNQFNSPDALMADMPSRTWADLTAPQQTALRNWLDAHEVPTTNFTGATTIAHIFRRVIGRLMSEDESFALGLQF